MKNEKSGSLMAKQRRAGWYYLMPGTVLITIMGQGVANFGYASALSFVIFVMVAILSFISMKAGDKRD